MRIRLALLASALALVCPFAAQADTFQYTFTGSPYVDYADFTFSTNALITSQTTVTPTSCSYNLGGGPIACNSIVADLFGANFFYLSPTESWQSALEFSVPVSLTHIGTQTDVLGDTLTITDTSSVAATPEPSSLALLGTGLLAFAGVARKRFA